MLHGRPLTAVAAAAVAVAGIAAIAAAAAARTRRPPERFAGGGGAGGAVLATSPLNHMRWILPNTTAVLPWTNDEPLSAAGVIAAGRAQGATTAVVDPIDADRWKLPIIGHGPTGYFVCLMDPSRAFYMTCDLAFLRPGANIGYLDVSDMYMARALELGYRLPGITRTRIPMDKWGQLDQILAAGKVDAIVAYVVLGGPLQNLLMGQNLSILGMKGIDADRVRAFYPYVDAVQGIDARAIFRVPGSVSLVMAREKDTTFLSMKPILCPLPPLSEGFASGIVFQSPLLDAAELDSGFRCYNDLQVHSKTECDSSYDAIGDPKQGKPTVWDQPCVQDADCPYFKANRWYPNARGGCQAGGVCEMPVGVWRTGFRKHVAEGIFAPFCYGDGSCAGPLPDYVFAQDTAARQKYGLSIRIPLGLDGGV